MVFIPFYFYFPRKKLWFLLCFLTKEEDDLIIRLLYSTFIFLTQYISPIVSTLKLTDLKTIANGTGYSLTFITTKGPMKKLFPFKHLFYECLRTN